MGKNNSIKNRVIEADVFKQVILRIIVTATFWHKSIIIFATIKTGIMAKSFFYQALRTDQRFK